MTRSGPATVESHEGGCLCGALRYRISGPIESVVHCHCRMCQRAHGAPAVTWVTVPDARFAFTRGTPEVFASSDHGRRGFCRSCGAQILFRSTRRPGEVDVTLGTLDYPERHPAERHVWTSSRLPWLRLDEHLPAAPEFTPGAAPGPVE